MTFAEALAQATARLQQAGIDNAPGDARKLLAFAAGVDPTRLTLLLLDEVPPNALPALERALADRLERKPVAQIIGTRAFWGRDFIVTPDVLDPRPETEHLVELALARPFASVLDLGTGSGVILATLLAERPGAEGLGVDASDAALAVARQNLDRHAPRARLHASDWFAQVQGRFDLIVSNPPYIAAAEMAALAPELSHEPHIALTDDADGLTAYRVIADRARAHLEPGGRIIVEIGAGQGHAVQQIFAASGWKAVEIHKDYAGHDRNLLVSDA